MVFINNSWNMYTNKHYTIVIYKQLQKLFSQIQKPFSYYYDIPDSVMKKMLHDDDPLRLMKHLDAFVNEDIGYGWDDICLLDKKTIDKQLINLLMYNNGKYCTIFPYPYTQPLSTGKENDCDFQGCGIDQELSLVLDSDTLLKNIPYNDDPKAHPPVIF